MFGNNKTKETGKGSSSTTSFSSSHSFNSLVQGTLIEGDVHSKNDFRVDGTIKGSLKCEAKVVIGPTGAVEGQIRCDNAAVEGRFEGGLHVSGLLTIKEKARVNGEVRYGKLVVQPGAVLIGDVRLGGQKTNPVKSNPLVEKEEKGADKKPIAGNSPVQKESAG